MCDSYGEEYDLSKWGNIAHLPDSETVEIYPEMLRYAAPDYPKRARRARIEGVVWVRALVARTGKVLMADVFRSSGNGDLDDAAVSAAYDNEFRPGIQKGKAINCWVTYRVNFQLEP